MKRANDFVSVNPNSPKKRRRKKAQERDYGELVRFGSTGMASDFPSTRSLLTSDENRPHPTLGGPWTPLPDFRAWDSSKQSGSNLPTTLSTRRARQDTCSSSLSSLDATQADDSPFSQYTAPSNRRTRSFDVSLLDTDDGEFLSGCSAPSLGGPSTGPSTPSESPPILLKLRSSMEKNSSQTLEASNLHVYESSSLTPSQIVWRDCKQKVLKAIADARRSPLDLILDILDTSQDEYEQYRLRWFSPSCNKLSGLLDGIFVHPKGRDLLLSWMHPHCLETVCLSVASEMDLVVKELSLPSIEHVSTEFISNWTLERVVEPATRLCPSLLRILEAAAQTQEAKRKNKIKVPKTVRRSVVYMRH